MNLYLELVFYARIDYKKAVEFWLSIGTFNIFGPSMLVHAGPTRSGMSNEAMLTFRSLEPLSAEDLTELDEVISGMDAQSEIRRISGRTYQSVTFERYMNHESIMHSMDICGCCRSQSCALLELPDLIDA